MDFQILGPLEVTDDDRALALGGDKQRALLALLLVHANETLGTDRLIEELWDGRPPATAVKTVQMHVCRLRRALATGGDDADGASGIASVVVTRGHGYELRVDPDELDLRRFERLAAEGRAALAAGRPGRAAATLGRALALWRGPPLSDLVHEPCAVREAERLEDLRVAALEQLVDAKMELGREAEVLAQLEELIAQHPYRERLRAQLMLALYRSDRQADALQAYHDARRRLVADIGIEPGERLRGLERAVLAQDPSLLFVPPGALPPELDTSTLLAGRERELEWLREQWRRASAGAGRLVLLSGPGGIGKTRLASELARELHRDGVTVRYGSAGGTVRRPTLLVLDDDGRDRRADALARDLPALPLLVLATARDRGAGIAADAALELGPLDAEAVRAVAALYAPPGARVPTERLRSTSAGVPARLHRAARDWALEEARAIAVPRGRASERSPHRMRAMLAGVAVPGRRRRRSRGYDRD